MVKMPQKGRKYLGRGRSEKQTALFHMRLSRGGVYIYFGWEDHRSMEGWDSLLSV